MLQLAPATGSAEVLILTAERLFAERGLASVSAREIAAAAGQRNTSAVGYHFGSRDGLIDAIFDYRMARIGGLLAGLPEPIRTERVRRALQMATSELATHERALASGTPTLGTGVFVADLVDSVVAVLQAPVSATTSSQLRRSAGAPTNTQEATA